MSNSFINHIATIFGAYSKPLLLVRNPDDFLKKEEVQKALLEKGIRIFDQDGIQLRIDFELKYKQNPTNTIYLISSLDGLLEDIKAAAVYIDFQLSDYFPEYHAKTILGCDLTMLEILFEKKPVSTLNKTETESYIAKYSEKALEEKSYDLNDFREQLNSLLAKEKVNWHSTIEIISKGLLGTIGTKTSKELLHEVTRTNEIFQTELSTSFKQSINSSPIKRPRVVSKILDHLDSQYKSNKVVLVVVDGMAYWQYLILKKALDTFKVSEDITYSWIPSITQLSRQAIFKGSIPESNYIQNPRNEEKNWFKYWENKGLDKYQIKYNHETIETEGLDQIKRFGIVYKDLDEKMHSSTDYADLKNLTENWMERSKIISTFEKLLDQGFTIFLTTDHGNVPANGWRNLKGREKLGTNKSGSRSARHLEYSEQWIADEFLENNPDLKNSIVQDDRVLYIKDNLSFSNKSELVTHGGSHILEVLIPFIKIENG